MSYNPSKSPLPDVNPSLYFSKNLKLKLGWLHNQGFPSPLLHWEFPGRFYGSAQRTWRTWRLLGHKTRITHKFSPRSCTCPRPGTFLLPQDQPRAFAMSWDGETDPLKLGTQGLGEELWASLAGGCKASRIPSAPWISPDLHQRSVGLLAHVPDGLL